MIWMLVLFLLPQKPSLMPPTPPPVSKSRTQATPVNYRLEWDYFAPGPVWFEVWSTTNLAQPFSLYATTDKTNAATVSIPLQLTNTSRFFIIRAVNEFGSGPWAK